MLCCRLDFSTDKWATTHYRHKNIRHLPLAADTQTHFREVQTKFNCDLFFCGVAFANRKQWIQDCTHWMRKIDTKILGAEWPKRFAFAENRRISNSELAENYSRARITLNLGRNLNLANNIYNLTSSTPGPRTFEAAMAGTVQCYFTSGLEITDYFKQDEEIILFESPNDLYQQVNRIISNDCERYCIAKAAQARAKRDHTYLQRAKKIVQTCLVNKTINERVI